MRPFFLLQFYLWLNVSHKREGHLDKKKRNIAKFAVYIITLIHNYFQKIYDMTAIIIIVVIVLAIGLYIVSTQRNLVNAEELVKNALSDIGVQMNTRWDALTALVKMIEKYSKYEHDTLMDVINARRSATVNTTEEAKAQQEAAANVMSQINAVAEQYPELKASELYTNTMNQLNEYENNVRMARQIYNDSATRMNSLVRQLPSSFVANLFGFKTCEYLQVDKSKTEMPNI